MKSYKIILHDRDIETSYSYAADVYGAMIVIPNEKRPSTTDIAKFRTVLTMFSRRAEWGNVPDSKDHAEVVEYLKHHSLTSDSSLFSFFRKNPSFDRLGIVGEPNKTPEYFLSRAALQNEEPLLFVRHCDDPFCSLNPEVLPIAKQIITDFNEKIMKYVTQHFPNKNEPIVYAGFASGLFLRDLQVIQQLIALGYQNIELYFIDPAYENFIKQVQADEPAELKLSEQVDVDMQFKAIKLFSNVVANRVNCDEQNPLSIHLFSRVDQASMYLYKKNKKLNLLIGQDFFTSAGTYSEKVATPDAHKDFMFLAESDLLPSGKGLFFEIIKDDTKNQIYSCVGAIEDNYFSQDGFLLNADVYNTLRKTKTTVNNVRSLEEVINNYGTVVNSPQLKRF